VAQLGARLDGIEEVEGSNPFGSTSLRLLWRASARQASRKAKPKYHNRESRRMRSCRPYLFLDDIPTGTTPVT
jgi:hypothetical protein